MKIIKILLIIIMISLCTSASAKVIHYLGGNVEFNIATFAGGNYDMYFGAGIDYAIRFHKYFSLENKLMAGYSFLYLELLLDYHWVYINRHEMVTLYTCHPLINIPIKDFYITISTLGFKLKFSPFGTRQSYIDNEFTDFKSFYDDNNMRLTLGVSEKVGFNIIAGRSKNINITVFYVNIDVLFDLITYDYSSVPEETEYVISGEVSTDEYELLRKVIIEGGIGMSVTVKLNNRNRQDY